MKEIETRKIFHQNGQLKAEYQINSKGERNGICKSYHENGQLRNLLSFTNGIQNPGQIITYHPNGEKSREVILSENGNLNGLYTEWYENGKKKAEGFYRNDLCFTDKEYDENGCLIDYKLLKFDNGTQKFYNLSNNPSETADLLLTNMSATDITNYNYLCSQLATLVGTSYCATLTSDSFLNSVNDLYIVENPFFSKILVNGVSDDSLFVLYSINGEKLFEGKNIASKDFSYLTVGTYFLKVENQQRRQSHT